MVLLLFMFMLLMVFMMNISPQKMVFSLTLCSIILSLICYSMTSSVFLMSAVIISFSSGMMILFSYCSMMSTHEEKNNMKMKTIMMTTLPPVALYVWPPVAKSNIIQKSFTEMTPTMLLIMMMIVVILSMVSMNTTFFNPTKKLMSSYLQEKKAYLLSPLLLAIFYLSFMISSVGVLLAVAFFTLMERKVMGLMHYRKGPNKVMIWGLLQPISDAAKLLTKENTKIQPMKLLMFLGGPTLGMFLMLSCWAWYQSYMNLMSNNMKIFTIMAIMSLSAFIFMLTSWGSNSKYAIIGGYRAISQVISYEVCLVLFLFVFFYMSKSYNMDKMMAMQKHWWVLLLGLPLFFLWLLLCMAETNRTPFDLAEGESEIVSGFNIEYGAGTFAMIFIAEYGMILFLSFITAVVFLGGGLIMLKTMLISFIFVWVRCSFPRVRYDKLMSLSWKISLPYSICLLCASLSTSFL